MLYFRLVTTIVVILQCLVFSAPAVEAAEHFSASGVPDLVFTITPAPPVVSTGNVTYVTGNSASLNGTLISKGDAASVNVSFQWGTVSGNYSAESVAIPMSNTGLFSANITALDQGTTYYYRAKATGNTTAYGAEFGFATRSIQPIVQTTAAPVSYTEGICGGNLISFGSSGTVNVSFQWGLSSGSYPDETAAVTLAPKAYGQSSNNTPLLLVRASQFNSIEQLAAAHPVIGANPYWPIEWLKTALAAYGLSGDNVSFTNLTAVTIGQDWLTTQFQQVQAILVDIHRSPSVWEVYASGEYRLLPWSAEAVAAVMNAFPERVTAATLPAGTYPGQTEAIPGFASIGGQFYANIHDLNPGTRCYYRAKAVGNGTSYGAEMYFSTASTVTTGNATNIGFTSATLNGVLRDLGPSSANVSFEWHASTGNVSAETPPVSTNITGPFSANITVPNSGASYYFRAKAVGNGTGYGDWIFFTTNSTAGPPPSFLFKWGTDTLADGHLNFPRSIAVDFSDNVYVADANNSRIQKYSNSDNFTLKWGAAGAGDGQFGSINSIAIDPLGNVYVADGPSHPGMPFSNNNRIQKFTSSGAFVTKWGSSGSGDGQFFNPLCIATDNASNVYVLDSYRVQKFTSSGAFITKWGSKGTGDGQFNNQMDMAVGPSGYVYVLEPDRIQKFTSDGVFVTRWGTGGTGDGQFSMPWGMGVDVADNVYIADTFNYRIQKFSGSGVLLGKWGIEGSGEGQFKEARDVAVDTAGNVYIADTGLNMVHRFSNSGTFVTRWGSPASGGSFNFPRDVAVDEDSGNLYVTDMYNNRVQKFSAAGTFISQWGSFGSGDGQLNGPIGIAVGDSNSIYVVDSGNHRIQKFNSSGDFITKWGSEGSGAGQFRNAYGIAPDLSGNVYVTDNELFGVPRIQKFSGSGHLITSWSINSTDGHPHQALGIAYDDSHNVYVADAAYGTIRKFTSTGSPIATIGTYGTGDGQLGWTTGLAVDHAGNIYVVNGGNNSHLHKFNSSGEFVTRWCAYGIEGTGNGQFGTNMGGIAVGPSHKIYVVDPNNNRIQVFGYQVEGWVYDATGGNLAVANITVDGGASAVSDANGFYNVNVAATGFHTLDVRKTGFRSQSQTINVTDITTTLMVNFRGDTGLIPNAPDLSYVLACINKWQFPLPYGTGLGISKVLAVINAWKFPLP